MAGRRGARGWARPPAAALCAAAASVLALAGPGRGQEAPPLPKGEAERRILRVLDDLDRNRRAGNMNVPVADGRLLRVLAESIGAKRVVEIGTSNGYSGLWFCLALRGTGGRLSTFEVDRHRAALARESFRRAGVEGLPTSPATWITSADSSPWRARVA